MSAHLLIVDDEEEIREMLSRHFRFLGYEVHTACDGVDALKILAEVRIEVVVSDIMMPRMNGIDLLRVLRTQFPMIHVIMVTGYITLDNALSCLRLGADTCVFKPLEDLTELEEAVARAVDTLKRWQDKLKQLRDMKSRVSEASNG